MTVHSVAVPAAVSAALRLSSSSRMAVAAAPSLPARSVGSSSWVGRSCMSLLRKQCQLPDPGTSGSIDDFDGTRAGELDVLLCVVGVEQIRVAAEGEFNLTRAAQRMPTGVDPDT